MDDVGTVVGTEGDVGMIRVGTGGTMKKVFVGMGVKVGLGVAVSVRGRAWVGITVGFCWAAWLANACEVSVAATNKGLISSVGAGGSRYGIASQEVRRSIETSERYKPVRFISDPLSNQGNGQYTDNTLVAQKGKEAFGSSQASFL
jgi:hypothetical protein